MDVASFPASSEASIKLSLPALLLLHKHILSEQPNMSKKVQQQPQSDSDTPRLVTVDGVDNVHHVAGHLYRSSNLENIGEDGISESP